MSRTHILRRTGKVRHLKELLEQRQILYLSCFFYSGKTVLLDQLAQSVSGPVLRFDAAKDDWRSFAQAAKGTPGCVLLLDSLEAMSDENMARELADLLWDLPEDRRAVLAGRAQQPAGLRRLCASGIVAQLDWTYVMLEPEEIEQLFLEYGIALAPKDIEYLVKRYWGYIIAMQAVAQRLLKAPGTSVRTFWEPVSAQLEQILMEDVINTLPEREHQLLVHLSPFEAFSGDMARMVTGRTDAPKAMGDIIDKSHILFHEPPEQYRFIPFVRRALFNELNNLYSRDYIDGLYRKAAGFYELRGEIPRAISYYIQMDDREKIRELLIRDTCKRPASGDYVALRGAYSLLSEATLMASPELMKGMCMIESLLMREEESERWYQALERFARETPAGDERSRIAREALAYLDIALPHRGTRNTLNTLVATARLRALTHSDTWLGGFSLAGNSTSLLNGGKDFCRWVPHGWRIYRLLKEPVELALGRGGSGVGDLAIGECELESNLSGDYAMALEKVCAGLTRVGEDLELRCAAIGIQSRILAAQGNLREALGLLERMLEGLPGEAAPRLRHNMNVWRLTLLLLGGDHQEAMSWLASEAPDETGDFNVLDRYGYMLKLRLYIIAARWGDIPLLTAKLRYYTERYDRPFLRVQLHLLQAMADRRTGSGDWRREMEAALGLAKRYRLARVIADEGIAIVDMLGELSLPEKPWEQGVLRLTRAQAARYPGFMKPAAVRPAFTDREYQVYSLMASGCRNAKIAEILNITERTVKHYTALIYKKLGVTSRAEAMIRAAELGDIR